MKIAFLIAAHTDVVILNRLIKNLVQIGDVYLHVDKKSKIVKSDVHEYENLHILKNPISVYWGGWSQVKASIMLLRAALINKHSKYVLLSGQDYPIKPLNVIKDYLLSTNENIINAVNIYTNKNQEVYQEHFRYRYNYDIAKLSSNNLLSRLIRFVYHKLIKNLPSLKRPEFDIYQGSNWFVMNNFSARYVVSAFDSNCEITRRMRRSFVPDEYYFNTLLANSNSEECIIKIIKTNKVGTHLKANIHEIDVSLSKFYTIKDFDLLKNSSKMFVRKVSTMSLDLLDKIDLHCKNYD